MIFTGENVGESGENTNVFWRERVGNGAVVGVVAGASVPVSDSSKESGISAAAAHCTLSSS